MDSGSTGNYIDVQEWAARGIKVEAEDKAEDLKMAGGSMIRTEGHVQFTLKCGGYKNEIYA